MLLSQKTVHASVFVPTTAHVLLVSRPTCYAQIYWLMVCPCAMLKQKHWLLAGGC